VNLAERVAQRYALKYVPKENKKSKVRRLTQVIRDKTGLGRSVAEGIADAVVRGREVKRLALQKAWPLTNGTIKGPKGSLSVNDLRSQI